MKLAHYSDLHPLEPTGRFAFCRRLVGRTDPTYRKRAQRLASAVEDHAEETDSELIHAITGDVSDRSRADEFEALRNALADAGDTEIVPGNHDVTSTIGQGIGYSEEGHARFRSAYRDIVGRSAEFPQVREFDGWRMILLDSSAHGERGTLFSRGRIGHEQLAFLKAQIAVQKPTAILLHHHPKVVDPTLAVVDADELMEVIDHPHVACFFGHRHKVGLYRSDGGALLFSAGKSVETGRVRIVDPLNNWDWYWLHVW